MIKFFVDSVRDICGEVDGKLLTAFGAALVIFVAVPVYYIWGLELPDKYWYTFAGFVGAGTGLASIERITQLLTNRKKNETADVEA